MQGTNRTLNLPRLARERLLRRRQEQWRGEAEVGTEPTRPSQSGAAIVSPFGSEGSVAGGGGAEAALKAEAAAMRLVWRRGVVRLVLVSAIAWAMFVLLALAFHLWSCSSSVGFLSGQPKQGPRGFPRFSWGVEQCP